MSVVAVFNENVDEYDRWYDENKRIYQAELQALKRYVPAEGRGLEIGVGTGRFAASLGVEVGVDPAKNMLELARQRGVEVHEAFGEDLPFEDGLFDYVTMVAVDPFVDDVEAVLCEARRVLKPEGTIVLGTIDRASPLGRVMDENRAGDKFYLEADFHAADELIADLRGAGFGHITACQTILGELADPVDTDHPEISFSPDAYEVHDGYGEGAFVVLSAEKKVVARPPYYPHKDKRSLL